MFGWDDRWGQLAKVTADGSSTTGAYRPYGLDCSGMVDWAFYNATDGSYVIGHGGGAAMQHSYCTPVRWEDAQIGDLAFYPDDEHVGIVTGWDQNGNSDRALRQQLQQRGHYRKGRLCCGRPSHILHK